MQDKPGRARALAGQLQTPAGNQIHRLNLADDQAHARGPQRFGHRGQAFGVILDANLDQGGDGKSQPRQTRRMQIVAAHDPHHRPSPRQGRGQGRDERRRARRRLGFQTFAAELMPAP